LQKSTINILESYNTFTLQELEGADLLERKDFKYVFNVKHLDSVLQHIAPHYKVLSINNFFYTDYHTNYYDTKNLKFYLQHHNGEANRFKIRTRKYVQSNLCFFEVKFKNNKNWTSKERYRISTLEENIDAYINAITPEKLDKSLEVTYSRITLISKDHSEKITLDCDLSYRNNDKICQLPQICIAEVKSKTIHPHFFRQYIKSLGYRSMGLSKYCFGIAKCYPNIKINNFKQTIAKIFKLSA
jgi:hypothetical protein